MDEITLIRKPAGIVECRICGLNFLPELEIDRERHDLEHRRIICGAVPYEVREFLKGFGWVVACNEGIEGLQGRWSAEIGKRAVVFAWWTRALANGIPENDFDKFMAAQFAFVDAEVNKDEEALEKASIAIRRWQKYGG
jgi:hypothetical protein